MLLLLPHQLFDKKYLNNKHIVLYEHPHYFTSYKYNKKKLLLHRASMQCYMAYLKKHKFKVDYVSFNQKLTVKPDTMFDPIDKIACPPCTTIESPNFLLTKKQYAEYRAKTTHFLFNNFYMWSKKQLNIIPSVKSLDKENRKALPSDKVPAFNSFITKQDQIFILDAASYVNEHFKTNPGTTDDFLFPISHTSTRRMLTHWIKHKFKKFGDFQDAIHADTSFLYHSCLSSSINIGLLNPHEIITKIRATKSIPMNSYEGYVRQLFWREYQRYCYLYCDFNQNYFGHRKRLTKKWYYGTLGIDPVDDCIKKAFATGYLNHIERLMVVGNFMNLSKISPKQGFKWFMEMSCDSYEWVMEQNVYDMVFFVTGGLTMRRPYASSSNYILKMSNYKKGDWSERWDKLYHQFQVDKKKQLWKYRYYFPQLKKM